jgi:hypothetical protein
MPDSTSNENAEQADNLTKAQDVKTQYEAQLLGLRRVVGVGVGYMPGTKHVAILVHVKTAAWWQRLLPAPKIPEFLEGIPVVVLEIEQAQAQ